MQKRRITRDEVARLANVSSATVSRVYNAPETVNMSKRKAVLEAARLLGYSPNKAASALRRTGTGIITLVEFTKPDRPYYWNHLRAFNWFYADVIKGVRQALSGSMYHLNLESVSDERTLKEYAEGSDGLIFFDVDTEEEAELIRRLSVPYIASHHTTGFEAIHSFSTDNLHGGRLQAEYLHSLGRSRPVYLSWYQDDVLPHAQRAKGFLSRWEELEGTSVPVIELEAKNVRFEEAVGELAGILESVDSLAGVNDLLLLKCMATLGTSRFDGCSLIGYDALPLANALFPFASIDIGQQGLYRDATRVLLGMIGGLQVEQRVHEVRLPVVSDGASLFERP